MMKPNTPRRIIDIESIHEYDEFLKRLVKPGIANYHALRVIERFSDDEGIITEEMLLIEEKQKRMELLLHVIELKDEQTLRLTMREIEVLKQLEGHEHVMTLLTNFRHRQYAALVLPAYSPLRDKIEYRQENKDLTGRHGSTLRFSPRKPRGQPWLFSPNAVAHVLRYVVDALDYMHKKNLVHTQVCAMSVFMDGGANVKLGGFSHSRRVGSKNWNFTGDTNCYPPEAYQRDDEDLSIHPSFDYWSLGLLTIELITGHRSALDEKRCRRRAEKYLNGEKNPPTLADVAPTMLIDGRQSYDPDVDSFLAKLLIVDPQRRGEFAPSRHPFLRRDIRDREARREWDIPVTTGSPMDAERSLLQEMVISQGSRPDFATDFLTRIIRAVRLAEKDFYPVFEEVPDAKLFNNYIGIEASVAIDNDDSEWSRDVLDVSQASSGHLNHSFARTPDRPTRNGLSGEAYNVQSNHPGLEKDYQRYELCFFVKKNWSDDERQVFTALQFARWYHRGIIKFPDLIRVCCEIEEVIRDNIITKSRAALEPRESVYFASALRRLILNPAEHEDRDTRHLCHMYVDVALTAEANAGKKTRMLKLTEGDPIDTPNGMAFLQASACYKDIDAQKFDAIEARNLGQAKVSRWELDESQRKIDATGPETKFYKLLYERRRNPNLNVSPDEDLALAGQARQAKLWSDYDRDFLYKQSGWNVPHKLDEASALKLYGNPFEPAQVQSSSSTNLEGTTDEDEDSLLEMQLHRTRVKQERDVILPLKQVEDVEARRAALANAEATLSRLKKSANEGGRKLGDQLKNFEANNNLNNTN